MILGMCTVHGHTYCVVCSGVRWKTHGDCTPIALVSSKFEPYQHTISAAPVSSESASAQIKADNKFSRMLQSHKLVGKLCADMSDSIPASQKELCRGGGGSVVGAEEVSEVDLEKQEKRHHCDLVLEGKIHCLLCLNL